MNDNQGRRGPGLWPLLLIPLVIFIAKGASRRRAMWASTGGYGRQPGFGHGGPSAEERAAFRLPPKIEWMLEAWHTRAHEARSADDASPTGTATA